MYAVFRPIWAAICRGLWFNHRDGEGPASGTDRWIGWVRPVRRWWAIVSVLSLFLLMCGRTAPVRAQDGSMTFGAGAGMLMVDPAGRNQTPFWVTQTGAVVDFTLYRLTLAELTTRHQSQEPWGETLFDVTGLPVAAGWQQRFTAEDHWSVQPVTLPTVASGFYVIEAAHPTLGRAHALVTVTGAVLMLKQGGDGRLAVWATGLQSGAPITGMTITAYDAQANPIAGATSSSEGVATLALGAAKPFLVVGQTDAETTVAGLGWQWRANGPYYDWATQGQQAHTIYLHTERPLYRPGDSVYYSAVIRQNLADGYAPLSPSQTVTVTLRDSRSNVVATQTHTADEFGTVAGDFRLDAEPPLGAYTVELTVGEQIQRQQLYVEEYRKPEYAVEVTTPNPFALAGDEIPITVRANYFFGQPVAGAHLIVRIYRAGWGYPHDDMGLLDRPWPQPADELVAEHTGVTGPDGLWRTALAVSTPEGGDAHYRVQATVTDARNLPVEGEHSFPVYWNSFRLTMRTDRYGYHSDEPVIVRLTAQDHRATPRPGESVTVRLLREEWPDTGVIDVAPAQTVTTDGAGRGQVMFDGLPQGWYRLRATSVDDRGREVRAEWYLWVYDSTGADGWFSSEDELSIRTDRASYAPGDTATLLIQSRNRGLALLTLERAGVYEERVVMLDGPMTAIDAPVTAAFAPNLYAKIHLFQSTPDPTDGRFTEGRLLVAQTELIVPATDRQLAVTVTPGAPAYGPGDVATLTVRVADSQGGPIRARVSLALVDEALFALQPDLSASLFQTFYGRQPNGVVTYHTLAQQGRYGGPVDWVDADPDLGEAPPEQAPSASRPAPRRQFLDTAFWQPDLLTDANGEATVTLTLPDNLTTWRIVARAVSAATQVGESTSSLLVTQEIIARPALPRFAVVGDRFAAGLVAQNFSGETAQGQATLAADQLILLDGAPRAMALADGATATGQWTVVAAQPGRGLVTTTLETSAGADVVELALPIKPFAAPARWSAAGQADPVATATFTVPANAVNEASRLTVHLAPSVALGLLDGLDDLIDFPYGCVEQTMSRILPTAVAAQAYEALGVNNPKAAQLPAMIGQGLQRLYGFQHESGSWGWFYDDDGGLFLTAYVLYGLTTVQQAGHAVDEAVLNRGFAYLDSVLATSSEPGAQAFALYVKANAGRGDLPRAQALAAQADQLDATGLAALALALHVDGDGGSAGQMVDRLTALARTTPAWVYWPLDEANRDWFHWQSMTSTEKNTALALRALLALRPQDERIPKIVRWLMDHRQGAGWGSYGSVNTQATAFAVLGLADYIGQTGEMTPDYAYALWLNGEKIAAGQVTPATARQPIPPVVVAGDGLRMGVNELRIERSAGSSGQLYFGALLEQRLFYDGFAEVTSEDQGIGLTRRYRLVEGQPRTDGAYNVGDLVEVTLVLQAHERMAYVLVEDPIPAGFEGLNERVNPHTWGSCIWCERMDAPFWQGWGYNRKDVRDDRVDFFISELWPGEHTITYLMRAVTAGEYSAPPGQVYPMYNAQVWGRSASAQVVVAPDSLQARPALVGDFDRSCEVTSFDARLAASSYGAAMPGHSALSGPVVTLRDVMAVTHRVGATCLSDLPPPGEVAGEIHLQLRPAAREVQSGASFSVDIVAADIQAAQRAAASMGGWGVTLHYDASQLALLDIAWASTTATPLGPTHAPAQNQLTLGATAWPADWPVGSPLATITFAARGAGATAITLTGAEAADRQGRMIQATAASDLQLTIVGVNLYLPVVGRP